MNAVSNPTSSTPPLSSSPAERNGGLSSLQNPRVKAVCALQSGSRIRRQEGLFVVEGLREISMAIASGYTVETLFYCSEIASAQPWGTALKTIPTVPVTKAVFGKMAYRESSDGLLAVVQAKQHTLEGLQLSARPFIIVAAAIEKPGNLGAILRTADAGGVDALIVCDPLTDVYNPNIVRSSLGCVFTQPLAVCRAQEAWAWLLANGITVYAAALQGAQGYHETDWTRPCAVVMGTEADGLPPFWLQHADARVKIPMHGKIDSLNVSVSTAILTFEALRQRGFETHNHSSIQ
jgi:TrmH family RNA methyltransferase